jgi:hypothetical protein
VVVALRVSKKSTWEGECDGMDLGFGEKIDAGVGIGIGVGA